mgnify:CR=1 FL=1
MQILKVTDEAFRQYGKVIKDLDVSDIITAMSETPCPDDVVYEPSIESLEACKSAQSVSDSLYGAEESIRRAPDSDRLLQRT